MPQLTTEQAESIKKHYQGFQVFLTTQKGIEWEQDRKIRQRLIQDSLSKERINVLTEDKFGEIVKGLWATDFWSNKDYKIGKLLKDNNYSKMIHDIDQLLHEPTPLEQRFDYFRSQVKGLGPSSITEILAFFDPNKYCIWNDKPKNILPFLNIKLLDDKVFKYSISGSDYVNCIVVLALIRQELSDSGLINADFIDVDFFLAYIFYEVYEKQVIQQETEKQKMERINKVTPKDSQNINIDVADLGHSDVQGILLELGNLLGYDTYVADPSKSYNGKLLSQLATLKEIPQFTLQRLLDTIKNIDVIWFEEEFPTFCFEIEHTTGVTLGLLRLYQIRKITDAKFFIIAPSEIISKFETEINKDPFHQIRDRYTFRSYLQLATIYEYAKGYSLMKKDFFEE